MRICGITCTGGRPEAFALCEKYVTRQTQKLDQWIVVDDGVKQINPPKDATYIRCEPMVGISYSRNLQAALARVDPSMDAIVFIEDDDWYAPVHVEILAENLLRGDIAGHIKPIYYNVKAQRILIKAGQTEWTSLCCTGLKTSKIDALQRVVDEKFIDMHLWQSGLIKALYDQRTTLGIKGMPGRGGIGSGHMISGSWPSDPAGRWLQRLIGVEDALVYNKYRR